MQKRIEDVQGLLTLMSDGYRRVCAQTESVKTACQGLQSRQAQLSDASGRIAETLRVYDSLAPIAQLVNRPGDRVCLDKGFLPALDRCESAIEFLGQHPARDSELYLMRFSQCRMRALTLIKIHALRVFRSLSSESMREPQSAHTRFQAASRSLSPLLRALQTRAHQPTERQVWVDVVTAYFAARRAFLRPHLKRNLDRISSESAQAGDAPVDAMRDWCAFTMGLCADEHRLYSEFFEVESEDVEMLRGHLDQTMAAFYEHVRPLIIHESDVHVLASLSLTLLTFQ
ncbi:Golgi transport complex subunit 3, partial [Linderina pennispora]